MPVEELDPAVPPTAATFLRRVLELRNTKEGAQITSHRAKIGPAIVFTKRAFRGAFQPFINELLNKQTEFNEAVVHLSEAIYRDMQSIEGGAAAMRTGVDARLKRIEERLARIEERLSALDAAKPQD